MPSIKSTITRKAIKATAKHGAHGTATKLGRNPIRAVTLLAAGAVLGGLAGWTAGRSAAPSTG
jgi:hypothetical protein